MAARSSAATRPVVLLLALIPGAVGILIYVFLGPFFGVACSSRQFLHLQSQVLWELFVGAGRDPGGSIH